jgi:hypothetical protein
MIDQVVTSLGVDDIEAAKGACIPVVAARPERVGT